MNAKLRSLVFAAPFILGATGCEWFTDFKRQPSLWTWEPVKDSLTPSRGNPQMSVPITGMAVAGFQVSYQPLPGTIDSMAGIPNPHPINAQSLMNGRKYYQVNCQPCHGDAGMGDGPATKFGMPGINLITDVTRGRTDGYIFGMIRNGRGLMPSYNRIEEPDRWDVVNYLRGLQGRAGQQVATGALAAPGVTGDKLYGVSRTAPTRPPPYMNARGEIRGGAGSTTTPTVSQDTGSVQPPAGAALDTAHKTQDSTKREIQL